jgi:hypothetical protein
MAIMAGIIIIYGKKEHRQPQTGINSSEIALGEPGR